jgi:hypothetical protein
MVIVRNIYDGSIYSFDGDDSEVNADLISAFPHICDEKDLKSNLMRLGNTQSYSVWTNTSLSQGLLKTEALPSGIPEAKAHDMQFKQKYAKHIYEHLPPQKRNVIRSIMVGCNVEPTHPYYYSMALSKPIDYKESQPFRNLINRALKLKSDDVKRFSEQVSQSINDIDTLSQSVVYDPINDTFIQASDLNTFKKSDAESSYQKMSDNPLQFGHKLPSSELKGNSALADVLGADNPFHKLLDAAKFISGRNKIPLERARYSFVRFEDDPEAAALYAVGLQDNEQNRKALKEVADSSTLGKAEVTAAEEPDVKVPDKVEATDGDGKNAADEINNAIATGGVHPISLVGKHSKGTLIARDPRTMHVWLLKPGSGSVSPAAGVADETASQSKREAAFSHIARLWRLGPYCIRSELLKVNNGEWACLYMLPYDYQNADKWKKADNNFMFRTLEHYRTEGILHKIAVLDYVLGNPDRHAQNIMISRQGSMVMIDHGSAFAGKSFSPGSDDKSFIPFYLRYGVTGFSQMDNEERIRHMPRVSKSVQIGIQQWIMELDMEKLTEMLTRFGINPDACARRLSIVKGLLSQGNEIDEQINLLWLTT